VPAAVLLLACVLTADGGRARAGTAARPPVPRPATERPVPAPAPAPTPAPTPTKTQPKDTPPETSKAGIFAEKPDDHYVQGERVDPFTLGKPPMRPVEQPPPPPNGGEEAPAADDPWGLKLHEMRRTYADVELQLSSDSKERFSKIGTECGKHILSLETDIRELLKKEKEQAAAKHLNGFQGMLEKFQRLQATAKRLQLREDVESDFASKKVLVQGIVWRPQSPTAAVNGQMVSEGTVLQVGGDKGGTAQVYRIRKDSVVFMYRGIQVTAHLQRGSH